MNFEVSSLDNNSVDYRHKKFGRVRSPSIKEEPQFLATENRSGMCTPFSDHNESTCSTDASAAKQISWNADINEADISHLLPKKRRRLQHTISRDNLQYCNAPKKSRLSQHRHGATTPEIPSDVSPMTTLMPNISKEALTRICQYNKNMVRKFPKKERSTKDQERRDKNTLACRMSRRLKKLEHLAVEEQYKIFVQQHFDFLQDSMRAGIYLNELIKFGADLPRNERNEEIVELIAKKLKLSQLEKIPTQMKSSLESIYRNQPQSYRFKEAHAHDQVLERKKSFSIAFLLGSQS